MSLETSRLRITGVTGGPLRITGASLVNGAYELATAGGADYELQTERQTIMDNILFIPGIANPVSEINQLLFGQGQQGTFIAPSLTASLISGSTFGTGVETLPDLSPRNNPFSQANSGNRAAWFREPKTGRRNLWQRTEEPGNAYWTKTTVTLTPSTDAPPGFVGSTNFTDTGSFGGQLQRASTWTVGQQHVVSCYAKASGNNIVQFRPLDDGGVLTQFNLSTGAVGTLGSTRWSGHLMQDLGNGWYRVSAIYTPDATTVTHRYINPAANSGADGILMTGFMVNDGAVLQPYQRVTTAFDVTESGQRDCYGVRADGTDDGYVTSPIPFGSANAVTIFAAYRALVGTPRARITGYTVDTSNFTQLEAPGFTNNRFEFGMRLGDTGGSPFFTYTAPTTRILTAVGTRFLQELRVDGALQSTTTVDFGTNTIGTVPLDLFFRSSSNDRFANGSLFALIYVAGTYPLSTIQRVERILSRITPTVNL
jgi:hypothetical protein